MSDLKTMEKQTKKTNLLRRSGLNDNLAPLERHLPGDEGVGVVAEPLQFLKVGDELETFADLAVAREIAGRVLSEEGVHLPLEGLELLQH